VFPGAFDSDEHASLLSTTPIVALISMSIKS
jgi:hypothetical protein